MEILSDAGTFGSELSINPSINSETFTQIIKHGSLRNACSAMFRQYCEYSTIHGVRYFGERKRSIFEKIFWLIIFVASLYFCTTLIINIWIKWNETPVIVSFSDKSTPIWKIPFPTITICSDIRMRSDVFHFSNYAKNLSQINGTLDDLTDEEKFRLDLGLQVCDFNPLNGNSFGSKILNESVIESLTSTSPFLNGTFKTCSWDREEKECHDILDRTLTGNGICYAFNLPALSDLYTNNLMHEEFIFPQNEKNRKSKWNIQDGFEGDAENETYPYRCLSPYPEDGLTIHGIGSIDDIDAICSAADEGFKIIVSTPGEQPEIKRRFFSVPFGYEVLISLKPKMITTAKSAMVYPPDKRHCFYNNERTLGYFKVYTQQNCEIECLTNYTLTKCGCVQFQMPRTESIPVCGSGNIKCLKSAKIDLLKNDFEERHKIGDLPGISDCHCLPSCTSLKYDVGITQAPLSKDFNSDYQTKYNQKITIMRFFFQDNLFWTSERSKLYGTIEFIANAGGLMGLFMGISVISFVEILYFCTIRLKRNLMMRYHKSYPRISHIGVSKKTLSNESKRH